MKDNAYLKKFVLENADILKPYAKRKGLNTDHYGLAEALSTKALEAALYKVIEADESWDMVKLKRTKLLTEYDATLISGESLCVENKLRPTFMDPPKVSVAKIEFLLSVGGWIIMEFMDTKQFFIWDLTKYKPKISKIPWTKHHNTIDPKGEKETEYPYEFDVKKAIYSGYLDDNWLYEDYFE